MSQEVWNAVDSYLVDRLVPSDPVLEAALAASDERGLPAIAVSPTLGKFLNLLAQIQGAKRILEIGTLGGYSTIWLARALPADGELITLEFEPHHAEVAQANIDRAGVADKVTIHVGPALSSLPNLQGQFDFIFIDADKPNNPNYVEWALKLSRPGTVIVVDNVVRNGEVADPSSEDASVIGTRALMDFLANEPRLQASAVQTVGSKGYDGFALLRVV